MTRIGRVRRWIRRIWVAAGVLSIALLVWNVQARGVAASLLRSGDGIAVDDAEHAIAFEPAVTVANAPLLIVLPGGLIDWKAYVPLARGLATAGLPTTIVRLPWRSAPTEAARRELWARIEAAVERWGAGRSIVLAGHSRGGALAARFVGESASPLVDVLGGLVLIGTTHPRDHDLSAVSFPVLRILASEDCVASPADAAANLPNLPPGTRVVEITGGNHRQFGYYGWQFGDCAASITREEQHRQVIAAVTGFAAEARHRE